MLLQLLLLCSLQCLLQRIVLEVPAWAGMNLGALSHNVGSALCFC